MTSQPRQITAGLIQMQCGTDPEANLEKASERVRQAAHAGANVICLPELFRSQYFCQRHDPSLFNLAEPIPGPSTERLGRVARDTGAVVLASLFEKRTAGVYHNTVAVLDADIRFRLVVASRCPGSGAYPTNVPLSTLVGPYRCISTEVG